MSAEVSRAVVTSAEAADLYAPVPTLLLELQTLLGGLTASAAAATKRGRAPFRPGADWVGRLGELAYWVYLLADQSGVEIDDIVLRRAQQVSSHAQRAAAQGDGGWPFGER